MESKIIRLVLFSLLSVLFVSSALSQDTLFTEGFESGSKPAGWSYEFEKGSIEWKYQDGGFNPDNTEGNGRPPYAYEGMYNAMFHYESLSNEKTKLVTPPLDLEYAVKPELHFWHAQDEILGDHDELKVYYKKGKNKNWRLLASYLDEVSNWVERDLLLPDTALTDSFYIAFEGKTNNGAGACIDSVTILDKGVVSKYVDDISYHQVTPGNIVPTNSTNNPILRLEIDVGGNSGELILDSLVVESLNTEDNDIANNGVKLYTYSKNKFLQASQIASGINFNSGFARFENINYDLQRGTNYLWITYDIPSDQLHSKDDHKLDALVPSEGIKINNTLFPLVHKSPQGSRTIRETIFNDNFEGTTEWALTGEFEKGTPQGLQAEDYGYPDPTSAYSGENVLGVDLTGLGYFEGNYENYLSDRAYTATGPLMDASYFQNISLHFHRWLNVEGSDDVYIDYSLDSGNTWHQLWNNSQKIAENDWNLIDHALPTSSDGTSGLKIRFAAGETDGSWSFSGWNIDDLFITGDYIAQDVGVTQWISPTSGCGHSEADSVTVMVKNFGGNPTKDTIPIYYSLDGGETKIRDTIIGSIPFQDSIIHTFETPADLSSPGWYNNVIASTALPSDEINDNNDYSRKLFITPTYSTPYYEDFENNYGYWRQGGRNSSWSYEKPDGPIIDSAASGEYVWVTNSTGYYNNLDSSYLESPCFNLAGIRKPVIEFKMWSRYEGGKDGLALYYSTDDGTNWNIVPQQVDFDWNWYNASNIESLGTVGWDTSTTTWMEAKQLLPSEVKNQSRVKFKFVMASNSSDRREGVAIDDIKIYEAPPDVGVTSLVYPTTQCYLSDSVQAQVNIENAGIDTLFSGQQIPLRLELNDQPPVKDTLELSNNLAPEESVQFTFNKTVNMSDSGDYKIKVYTALEDDPYFYTATNNDTITDTVAVQGMPNYSIGDVIGMESIDTTLDAGAGYDTYSWSTGDNTQTIHVTTADWYKVTVTNDYCSATDSVHVVNSTTNTGVSGILTTLSDSCVRTEPVELEVTVTNAGQSFSNGDSIPLAYQVNSMEPVIDTLWLNSSFNDGDSKNFTFADKINMSEAGNYTIKAYTNFPDDNNHENDTTTSSVNTWGTPDIELRYDTLLTSQADSLTLDAGSAFDTYNYEWQDGSTNQTFDITHNQSALYKVTVTSTNGCGTDADSTRIIANNIGIDALVYPINECEHTTSEQAQIELTNYSADVLPTGDSIPMVFMVDSTQYRDTLVLGSNLNSNSTKTFSLNPAIDMSEVGEHEFVIYHENEFDVDRSNDTIRTVVETYGYPDVELARDTIYSTQADTITLNAGDFNSYLWQDSTTTATYDVTENISREYKVTVSDAHGCGTDKDSVQVFTYNMALTEMITPSSSCELSSSEEIQVKVKNYSYDTIKAGESMDLGYIMNGTYKITETKTFNNDLLPGETFTYTFSNTADMSEYRTYQFDLFSDHPHDADHSNDTLVDAVKTYGFPEFDLNYDTLYTTQADTVELYPNIHENGYLWSTGSNERTLYVSKPTSEEYKLTVTDINGCSATDSSTLFTYDVGLTSMSEPVSDCELTSSESLTIEVTNNGADTLQSGSQIPVGYQVYGGNLNTVISDTINLTSKLLPGSTIQHTFSNTLDMSVADVYDFTVYTDYPNDAASGNDSLNRQVENYGYPQVDLGPDTMFTAQPDTLELDAGSGYSSYLWQDGSTSQTYNVTSNETNLYHVEVTNEHGCSARDSMQVIVDYDLKALSITSPPAKACGLSSQEKVTAKFYNQSRAIDADQTLTFTLVSPDGIHYNENYILSSPLNSGDTLEWKFSQTLDLSEETTHQIKAYVTYDTDLFPGNDTASKSIEVFPAPKPDLGKDTVVSATSYTLDPGAFSAYQWHDGSTNQTFKVSPGSRTADDKYHVTVTDQNGCTGRDTAQVILNIDDIEIAEILSPTDLCGTSQSAPVEFILENSGTSNIPKNTELPVSYQLNSNDSVKATIVLSEGLSANETLTYSFSEKIALSGTGDYDFSLGVEYEDDMWTGNNDTSYTFTVSPKPSVDLGPDTLETELPHTLDPGSYASYEWQDGSTGNTFEVTEPGTYSVTVSNQYGCTASDEIVIRNANAIGDNLDESIDYTVKIYPVPAEEHLMIDLRAERRKQFTLKLINTQGYPVHTEEVTMQDGTARLHTQAFPRGIYYLRIEAESGVETRKVILK